MKDSREEVVVSSWKTSSRRLQFWIAVSMEAVGVVTTSERRSREAGLVGEPHAQLFVLPSVDWRLESEVFTVWRGVEER